MVLRVLIALLELIRTFF
ncbi:damage-inducible type I toxin DinQ [Erwinia amylovora]